MRNKITFTLLVFACTFKTNAQNVGINASGAAPAASAMLDISATNRGLLIPRVNLTGTGDVTTIATPATSLMVYNQATAGAGATAVTPGYYYYNGSAWVRFFDGSSWTLTGNAGTSATTNFIGTIDNVDWVIRTNNLERARFTGANGYLGMGTTTPTSLIHAVSSGVTAVTGNIAAQGSGHLAYTGSFNIGAFGSLPSALVFADESAAGNSPALVSRTLSPASYASAIGYSDVWIAGYFGVDNASATLNPNAVYGQLNQTSSTLAALAPAIYGRNERGTTAGNPGYSAGVFGLANTQNQDGVGIYGTVFSNRTGVSGEMAGGYFDAYNYAVTTSYGYAWVGGRVFGTSIKIQGTGSVAEIVPTENHGRVTLICPESPEYWYQDYGTVKLVNGKAHVDLDPILADIIVVNDENPIRVFCTPVDMLNFNGVAIANRTATGFDIVELNGGTNSGTLDYQIIVKPKTNYGEGRFKQAPGPAWLKPEEEPAKAKAKNNLSNRTIFTWPSDWEVYGYEELAKKRLEELKKTPGANANENK